MESSDLLKKIPYMLMVLVGTAFIIQFNFGGLINLQSDVNQAQQQDFRRLVILENMINMKTSASELEASSSVYEFDDRRAVLPVEYFTRVKGGEDEIGYSTSGVHCYIDKVPGLDGQNYAFFIQPLEDPEAGALEPRELQCGKPSSIRGEMVYSPAILIRKANNDNPRLPVRIYVYDR